MPCLACARPARSDVCAECARVFRRAPERMVGEVLVRSLFVHEGAARRLVHRVKYQGITPPSLGRALATLLPADATALVPVPRVPLRRWRYGVDGARELSRLMASASGLPVVECLRPPLWVPRRAGPAARARGRPRFAGTKVPPSGAVLVDDVVTTGATLRAAAAATRVRRAITLTAAGHHLTILRDDRLSTIAGDSPTIHS